MKRRDSVGVRSASGQDRVTLRPSPGRAYDMAPANALIAKHRSLRYPYTCRFGQALLQIDDGVFCPTLTNASPLLLSAVEFRPGERVLDVFAGSGALGINGAIVGSRVVCVDIDPLAVRCAKKNAALNGVADRVDVRLGQITDSVSRAEKFDLIVANPPLLPGRRKGKLAAAMFDPELRATLAFIDHIRQSLAPDGRCYFLTSDVMDRCGYSVEWLCLENQLTSSMIAVADLGYEVYRVHKAVHLDRAPRKSV
jgi:methylase of polypeptide subunit release factors